MPHLLRAKAGQYCLAAILAVAAPAAADTFTFTYGGTTTNWSDPSNWVNGLVPLNSSSTQIIVAGLPGRSLNATIDTGRNPWILNSLTFPTEGASFIGFNINSTLYFQGPNPTITAPPFGAIPLSNIKSDSPLTINDDASLAGNITAPQLILTGTGISELTTSFTNNLTNGLVLAPSGSSIVLTADSSSALGTRPLTFNFSSVDQSATLNLANASDASNKNALVVNAPQSGTGPTVTIKNLTTGHGIPTWSVPSLTVNGNLQLYAMNTVFLAHKVTLNGNLQIFTSFDLDNVSGTGSITIHGTVDLGSNNTYIGGTTVAAGGYLEAFGTGALSTGPVAVSPTGTVLLGAGSANADITSTPDSTLGGTILYDGNIGASGHHITANTLTFDPSVTAVGGDSFTLTSGGTVTGAAAVFSVLTRTNNIVLPAGATILATDAAAPAIQNLGSAADLTLGFTAVNSANATVGAGTPWGTVTRNFGGTLTATSDFTLYSVDFSGSIAAAAAPVHVLITGQTHFDGGSSDFSGVSQFTVANGSNFTMGGALAGPVPGAQASAPPVDVLAGGILTLFSNSDPDSNIHLHTGAALNIIGTSIASSGLTGSGVISRDGGPVTFMLYDSYSLAGPQFKPNFIQAIDTVYLDTPLYLHSLSLLNPAATYAVRYHTKQNEVLNLNGGTLQFQTGGSTVAEYEGNGPGTIHIGNAGATFLASGDDTQLSIDNTSLGTINADITATGAVTVGTTDLAATMGHGGVYLEGTNSFASITVQYAGLGAIGPASLSNAPVTLNHALLLLNQPTSFPVQAYSNTLSVVGESTLQDIPSTSSTLRVSTINLGAPLHLSVVAGTFRIADLHVTADTSLTSQVSNRTISLDTLSQDAAHTLTLQGASGITKVVYRAAAVPSFAGAIDIANATLSLAAPQNAAITADFDIASDGILELASSYNFSSPTGPTLTGAGTVIIDHGTTLSLPIDSAFSGTIQINGTLLLTPALDPLAPTFNFTLLPAPEPASLTLLSLAAPLLLRRRRKR